MIYHCTCSGLHPNNVLSHEYDALIYVDPAISILVPWEDRVFNLREITEDKHLSRCVLCLYSRSIVHSVQYNMSVYSVQYNMSVYYVQYHMSVYPVQYSMDVCHGVIIIIIIIPLIMILLR